VAALQDVRFVIDENLLRVGKGVVAVRRDTARFTQAPVDQLLPEGILDPDWIPIVGNRGWVVITNDLALRTRPNEASLAITHKLKAVHLYRVAGHSAWDQLVRLTTRWGAIEKHIAQQPDGPWWLSLRASKVEVMQFEPGAVERP
jgi:hypothetical protein